MKQVRAPFLALLALALSTDAALAQDGVGGTAVTRLRGFQEVPAISSPGGGRFEAVISEDGTEIDWTLSYFSLRGNITQSHLHLGQTSVNGGIIIFLCSNLGNGPAGTPACPADPAEISGTIHAEDVIGAASQGLDANNLGAALRALRTGNLYVNVHTDSHPGGEIRGQLRFTPTPEE
jgi:hypothetical protein